jgi:GcrA cell cycle regulator
MTYFESSNLSVHALSIRHGNTTWTDDRIAIARDLWKKGWTASRIGGELNLTRSAVLGKLNRLGLMANSRAPGTKLTCDPNARVAGAKVGRRPDGFRRMPDKRPAKPLQQLFAASAPIAVLDIPPHERLPLQALTVKSCRFPIGDPGQPDFGFCNMTRAGGLPYCVGHARIAYRRPS